MGGEYTTCIAAGVSTLKFIHFIHFVGQFSLSLKIGLDSITSHLLLAVGKTGGNCCWLTWKAPKEDIEEIQEVTVSRATAEGISGDTAVVVVLLELDRIFTYKKRKNNTDDKMQTCSHFTLARV